MFARGLILEEFSVLIPGDEEISIPDNRPIWKSFQWKQNEKDSDDFWRGKLKVKFWHYLTPPHYTNSQNSKISFGYLCWFLGKNPSNFVPPAWILDNPYYHNIQIPYNPYQPITKKLFYLTLIQANLSKELQQQEFITLHLGKPRLNNECLKVTAPVLLICIYEYYLT